MKIKIIAVAVSAMALMAGAFASTASAQNQQEGLINVAIEDVIVQVPVAVAANICDVNVAVLATVEDDAAACEATAESTATAGPTGNNGGTQQEGLVNVLVDDVLVQVPIAVAANVCDVNVALLAEIVDEAAACNATADATATPGPGQGGGGGGMGIFIPIDIDLNTLTATPPGGSSFPIVELDDNELDDGGLGNVVTAPPFAEVQDATTVLDSQGNPLLGLTLLA
jgi:hypothetical protein